jgi:hypothetical protein
VACVAAIHHALRHVDPCAGDIRAPADIDYLIHWAAVNSNPQSNLAVILQCHRNLHRAVDGSLWIVEKNQRHTVASRYTDELARSLSQTKSLGTFHDAGQLGHHARLLGDQQL